MCGVAGEQRSCVGAREARAGEARRRAQSREREADILDRVARWTQGTEQILDERLPAVGERLHEAAVGVAVDAEPFGRLLDGAAEQHGGAIVQRVRERDLGVDELEPVLLQRQAAEERRGEGERVDRRADVVPEAG